MQKLYYIFSLVLLIGCKEQINSIETDVLVVGEGTGAIAAAIQSARSGATTILITPLPWLGGMLTSAGVSAIDGNHRLPAGLWGEFRDSLRKHYGGADSLSTGWVSNTMFEPSVGEYYWKQMAKREKNLTVFYNTTWNSVTAVRQKKYNWKLAFEYQRETKYATAKILIDGTDLGDIATLAGVDYDLGMDGREKTKEEMAPKEANDIIQDITYAITLKDFGKGEDHTIEKPKGYSPSQFYCSCQTKCEDSNTEAHPCEMMLSYGKLPNNKYMINWPIKGNDYYSNVIGMDQQERTLAYESAKNKSLQFVYFIQKELGYKNLGIAKNEYPSKDGLPLMPYHREGRRIHGLVQLNIDHLLRPYDFNIYRTGIAVGDYPIDHHHYERPDAPKIDFPKVPSFNVPIGSLLPKTVDHLIIADKSISVTNIVNGATRLQPVILQIGQVAGLLAAMATKKNISPRAVDIRSLQTALLKTNGYLLPFIDVTPDHPQFTSIQKIGATGLLRGTGIPYRWANQTWFYPDSMITYNQLAENMAAFDAEIAIERKDNSTLLTIELAINTLDLWLDSDKSIAFDRALLSSKSLEDIWSEQWHLEDYNPDRPIKRFELATLLDKVIQPFERTVDFNGNIMSGL